MARRVFGRIFKRGRTWYVRVRRKVRKADGSIRWKDAFLRCGRDRALAVEKLTEIRSRLDRERVLGVREVGAITLADFWKREARAIVRSRLTPKGFDVEERRVLVMAEILGDDLLREIDPARVEELGARLRARKGGRLTPATWNRYASTLSVVFKLAISRAYARANPVREVKRHREAVAPVPYLGPVDLERIYARCRPLDRPFVVLAAETGLRRGELLRLSWADVDLGRRLLVVRTSKSKRPRTVPLTPRAERELRALLEERGAVPMTGADRVFAALLAAYRRSSDAPTGKDLREEHVAQLLTRRVTKACKAAGFDGVHLHSMRHAFCSSLAQAGVPLPTIAKLAGHSTITVTARYAAHAPEGAEAAAIARLAEARGQGAPEEPPAASGDARAATA